MKKKQNKKPVKKVQDDIKNDNLPKISFGDTIKKIANANPKNIKDG